MMTFDGDNDDMMGNDGDAEMPATPDTGAEESTGDTAGGDMGTEEGAM